MLFLLKVFHKNIKYNCFQTGNKKCFMTPNDFWRILLLEKDWVTAAENSALHHELNLKMY